MEQPDRPTPNENEAPRPPDEKPKEGLVDKILERIAPAEEFGVNANPDTPGAPGRNINP